MPPLQGLGDGGAHFYKHSVLTGLKKVLKASMFPRRIRFGWETEPTGPVSEALIFLKLTPIVHLMKELSKKSEMR